MNSDGYMISILRRIYPVYLGDNKCLSPRNERRIFYEDGKLLQMHQFYFKLKSGNLKFNPR